MIRLACTLPAVAVAAFALVACDDPHESFAGAGVLQIDDFPPGFRTLPVEDPGGLRAEDDEPEECAAMAAIEGVGVVATAESDLFFGDETLAANDVSVYREQFVAEEVLRIWSDEEEAIPCMELLLSAIVDVGATDPFFAAAFGAFDVAASPLPVGDLGDERAAWRGRLDLEGREAAETFYIDLVAVRVDRAVASFFVLGIAEPADELRDSITASATLRLVEAAR